MKRKRAPQIPTNNNLLDSFSQFFFSKQRLIGKILFKFDFSSTITIYKVKEGENQTKVYQHEQINNRESWI